MTYNDGVSLIDYNVGLECNFIKLQIEAVIWGDLYEPSQGQKPGTSYVTVPHTK